MGQASRQRGIARRTALLALAIAAGALIGIGGYTFVYAEGLSYMSSDPKVCVNCHIMQPQYDSWVKSGHHHVATCADCHLPHDLIGRYTVKALNGWHHSKAFTLQDFHEPIAIKPANARVLQENCVACHQGLLHPSAVSGGADDVPCVHCHQTVGHGERAGLGGPNR
ncbi:MAG: cytochrome c nitrite reductase small subunit [Betaproteobacteria bacterium]|jgi:cytochrome c nitrite reductase small subunit